jgi:hypothetical protein
VNRLGYALAVAVLAMAAREAVAQSPDVTSPLLFRSLTPCRLLDTRTPDGGGIVSGTTRTVTVWGRCEVPTGTQRVFVNVTSVGSAGAGALQVWGASRSSRISVVRYALGATEAAGVLVAVDAGTVSVRPQQAEATTTDVLVDVLGYFEEPIGLDFFGAVPCRILDTAAASPSRPLAGGASVHVTVVGHPCAIPPDAVAIAAVVTVAEATGLGHVTLHAGDPSSSDAATVSFADGSVRAGGTVVPLGAGGFDVLPVIADGGSLHLSIEVTGYYR